MARRYLESMSTISNLRISFQGEKVKVHPSRLADVEGMDTNGDNYISEKEIKKAYGLKKEHGVDIQGQIHETKCWLAGKPNPYRDAYHSYQEVGQALKDYEKQYPGLCERVSLGKSSQGREIWALRISEGANENNRNEKPGVVITGCHHAREWMTVEVPLNTARELLEGYSSSDQGKERLQKGEIWVVPLVNPDGYEYSRNHNNMWRKTRSKVETTMDGEPIKSVGVDPNRNYDDGVRAHKALYRPDYDKPRVTQDDFEQGNDDPRTDVYRGPKGASEPEVQALLRLELGNENIKGVLDYHSYGETVMYPWGYTHRKPKGAKQLHEMAQEFNKAAGYGIKVQQSVGMYATGGSSNDIHQANGIIGFTLETNGCFQPHPSQIAPTCERYSKGDLAFIDSILERHDEGLLPERNVPRHWRERAQEFNRSQA